MRRSPSTTSGIEPLHRDRTAAPPVVARRHLVCIALACAGLGCHALASGQSVSLSGSLGDKALLVIDGKPRSVGVGSSVEGVRLLSVNGSEAVVELKGQRLTLPIGGTPISLGRGPNSNEGARIVMSAGTGGHFISAAKINGREVRLIVDTGATNVMMSEAEAERLGLDFRKGTRGYTQTANGTVNDHRISLASVQIGDVTVHQVEATVLPAPMTHIFAGNSYLSRFRMKVENDTLTLEKRF